MMEDINKLKDFNELEDFGNFLAEGKKITKKVLNVAVPPGPFTAAQDEAFRKAFHYGQRVGVEVVVTVVY